MEFNFSEDQRLLQQTVRDFLEGACPVERLRQLWDTETGRSPELWTELSEVGLPGLLVPEAAGGLGMNAIDQVLLLEETGRAALAEPLISTAAIAAPLLQSLGAEALAKRWLGAIAEGRAIVAIGHPINRFTADAHIADLLLMLQDDEVHALLPGSFELSAQPANDPSRRIFEVSFVPSDATRVASGETARAAASLALDHGALACAAEALGATDRLIAMAVEYASERKQFGVPIGSFQAVKHMLANLKVKLEYARSLVYRGAHSLANGAATRGIDCSMAKVVACEAAVETAKTTLQVHGAIGYTWEQDLHVWMRRAWTLESAWGSGAWHRARVAAAVIDGAEPVSTFGYNAPA